MTRFKIGDKVRRTKDVPLVSYAKKVTPHKLVIPPNQVKGFVFVIHAIDEEDYGINWTDDPTCYFDADGYSHIETSLELVE